MCAMTATVLHSNTLHDTYNTVKHGCCAYECVCVCANGICVNGVAAAAVVDFCQTMVAKLKWRQIEIINAIDVISGRENN